MAYLCLWKIGYVIYSLQLCHFRERHCKHMCEKCYYNFHALLDAIIHHQNKVNACLHLTNVGVVLLGIYLAFGFWLISYKRT
jgi:hypothetical protein